MKHLRHTAIGLDGRSPPVRGAWIETPWKEWPGKISRSPPVRGAWIETSNTTNLFCTLAVAPRAGGVD